MRSGISLSILLCILSLAIELHALSDCASANNLNGALYVLPNCERVCANFDSSGTSSPGDDDEKRYEKLKAAFFNCTYVFGNLEIKAFKDKRNFSFLSTIREISGALIILNNQAQEEIPLNNLVIVRGIEGQKSFVIARNPSLTHLHLYNLREISNGELIFYNNFKLCMVDKINWNWIYKTPSELKLNTPSNNLWSNITCPHCVGESCSGSNSYCWSQYGDSGNIRDNCQAKTREWDWGKPNCTRAKSDGDKQVDESARGFLAYNPNKDVMEPMCCDKECAAGCSSGSGQPTSDEKLNKERATDCLACRNVVDSDTSKCVSACRTVDEFNQKIYRLENFCVLSCPAPYFHVKHKDLPPSCELSCPSGYTANDDRICDEDKQINAPVCEGHMKGEHGNLTNTKPFTDCRIVRHHIIFSHPSFHSPMGALEDQIRTLYLPEILNQSQLFRYLGKVRVIMGQLMIQSTSDNNDKGNAITDLSFLSNLEVIYGGSPTQEVTFEIFNTSVTELPFVHLRLIGWGLVRIMKNPELCYVHEISWKKLAPHNNTRIILEQNRPADKCREEGKVCDLECKDGCWGPGNNMCVSCKNVVYNYQIMRALPFNNPQPFNVTRCLPFCSRLHQDVNPGLYQRYFKPIPPLYDGPNDTCLECHPECANGCTGPGPDQCEVNCSNVRLGNNCISTCPDAMYPDPITRICKPCHQNCGNRSLNRPSRCQGPSDYFGQGGCTECELYLLNDTGHPIKCWPPQGLILPTNSPTTTLSLSTLSSLMPAYAGNPSLAPRLLDASTINTLPNKTSTLLPTVQFANIANLQTQTSTPNSLALVSGPAPGLGLVKSVESTQTIPQVCPYGYFFDNNKRDIKNGTNAYIIGNACVKCKSYCESCDSKGDCSPKNQSTPNGGYVTVREGRCRYFSYNITQPCLERTSCSRDSHFRVPDLNDTDLDLLADRREKCSFLNPMGSRRTIGLLYNYSSTSSPSPSTAVLLSSTVRPFTSRASMGIKSKRARAMWSSTSSNYYSANSRKRRDVQNSANQGAAQFNAISGNANIDSTKPPGRGATPRKTTTTSTSILTPKLSNEEFLLCLKVLEETYEPRNCTPCHVQCKGGCKGPEDTDCFDCKVAKMLHGDEIFQCVDKCIEVFHADNNNICRPSDSYTIYIGGASGLILILIIIILVIVCIIYYFRMRNAKIKKRVSEIAQRLTGADDVGFDESSFSLSPSILPVMVQLVFITSKELERGAIIGSGAFGTVYRGQWTPSDKFRPSGELIKESVAIKELSEETSPDQQRELIEEARVLASVQHQHCVKFIGLCIQSRVQLVMQLIPLGSLAAYVRRKPEGFSSVHFAHWSLQIAKGMEYLENRGIVHRDLAARNVLVQQPLHVRISDFGLAKVLDNDPVYESRGGRMPVKWLAPESITHRTFSHKSDVWSYGVTQWEVYTYGAKPYEEIKATEMLNFLQEGGRLTQPTICSVDVFSILVGCWIIDPMARPSFRELVEKFNRIVKDPPKFFRVKNDKQLRPALESVAQQNARPSSDIDVSERPEDNDGLLEEQMRSLDDMGSDADGATSAPFGEAESLSGVQLGHSGVPAASYTSISTREMSKVSTTRTNRPSIQYQQSISQHSHSHTHTGRHAHKSTRSSHAMSGNSSNSRDSSSGTGPHYLSLSPSAVGAPENEALLNSDGKLEYQDQIVPNGSTFDARDNQLRAQMQSIPNGSNSITTDLDIANSTLPRRSSTAMGFVHDGPNDTLKSKYSRMTSNETNFSGDYAKPLSSRQSTLMHLHSGQSSTIDREPGYLDNFVSKDSISRETSRTGYREPLESESSTILTSGLNSPTLTSTPSLHRTTSRQSKRQLKTSTSRFDPTDLMQVGSRLASNTTLGSPAGAPCLVQPGEAHVRASSNLEPQLSIENLLGPNQHALTLPHGNPNVSGALISGNGPISPGAGYPKMGVTMAVANGKASGASNGAESKPQSGSTSPRKHFPSLRSFTMKMASIRGNGNTPATSAASTLSPSLVHTPYKNGSLEPQSGGDIPLLEIGVHASLLSTATNSSNGEVQQSSTELTTSQASNTSLDQQRQPLLPALSKLGQTNPTTQNHNTILMQRPRSSPPVHALTPGTNHRTPSKHMPRTQALPQNGTIPEAELESPTSPNLHADSQHPFSTTTAINSATSNRSGPGAGASTIHSHRNSSGQFAIMSKHAPHFSDQVPSTPAYVYATFDRKTRRQPHQQQLQQQQLIHVQEIQPGSQHVVGGDPASGTNGHMLTRHLSHMPQPPGLGPIPPSPGVIGPGTAFYTRIRNLGPSQSIDMSASTPNPNGLLFNHQHSQNPRLLSVQASQAPQLQPLNGSLDHTPSLNRERRHRHLRSTSRDADNSNEPHLPKSPNALLKNPTPSGPLIFTFPSQGNLGSSTPGLPPGQQAIAIPITAAHSQSTLGANSANGPLVMAPPQRLSSFTNGPVQNGFHTGPAPAVPHHKHSISSSQATQSPTSSATMMNGNLPPNSILPTTPKLNPQHSLAEYYNMLGAQGIAPNSRPDANTFPTESN